VKANSTAAPTRPDAGIPDKLDQPCAPNRLSTRLTTSVLCLLMFVFCVKTNAQSYSIDWYTIDGGGQTSAGGAYTVTGSQPDAGRLEGGSYGPLET